MPPLRRLGRIKPPADAPRIRLASYLRRALPPAPPSWDGTKGVTFPLYRNDVLGDCTFAALAHLLAIQAHQEHRSIAFTDEQVAGAYLAFTSGRDIGACELDVLHAAVKHGGFPANAGVPLAAWASLDPGDVVGVKSACALFHGLYLGVDLPISAQEESALWIPTEGVEGLPGTWGGHAVALAAYDPERVLLPTWGKLQAATWGWLRRYCDEVHVVVELDRRVTDAIEWDALIADVKARQGEVAPALEPPPPPPRTGRRRPRHSRRRR